MFQAAKMDESGVEMLKEIPGFKAILKAVLKQQMQMLVSIITVIQMTLVARKPVFRVSD